MGIGSIQGVPKIPSLGKLTQNQAKILMAVRSGHRYGYKIAYWDKSLMLSTIYKGLNRLTEQELLTVETTSGKFGPSRAVYSLTKAGKLALEGWEEEMKGVMSGN